ncbi:very-long-chain 3-oxoacyl-CoA reductase 1-like [Eucalyptus grandis]|uniref:very-long-chain 3-oxoacyl-CoA reductase 1-like n=1 Tax=Eucalyptus grandis TaxID=71139 RepID=UPI00192E87E3|nr:very-long-chain 3-oxoacyl-CoA reductase 1-like [Eucalyptus grandis]
MAHGPLSPAPPTASGKPWSSSSPPRASTLGSLAGTPANSKPPRVKTGVTDLTKLSGEEIEAAIAGATEGIDVGLLVNNAGSAYPYPRCFHEVDRELMESMLRVPLFIATKMTMSRRCSMLLPSPEMFSGASVRWIGYERQRNPYWLHAVQGFVVRATEAFIICFMAMFSRSIDLEYKEAGIDIQCQVPLFKATKMTMLRRRLMLVPSPETFNRASVRWIGCERQCNLTGYMQCKGL